MSAFFLWLEFSGNPINPTIAKSMLTAISAYGGDAQDLQLSKNLAIGVQSRWSTPEDVGERQPIYNSTKTECFLFDGRVDNRVHLMSELDASADLSDADLMYRFLQRFGETRLPEVIGPFVFVQFNLETGRVLAARDTTGGRYLTYYQNSQRLIIASTELAFVAHPDIGHVMNGVKIASWLLGRQEANHSACLKGLNTVDPGQKREWIRPASEEGAETCFYRPNPNKRIVLADDTAYANEFRRLLKQAVIRRLRSRTKVGVMLSGGLDSVPISIAAAEHNSEKPIAYSWIFNNYPQMDERRYSTPICQQLGIRQEWVMCDELWPQFDQDTHCSPLFPFALPYTEFQQQTFRQAKSDCVGVMLSGMQGDLLYETGNGQVWDQLKNGRLKVAFRELILLRQHHGLSWWRLIKRFVISPLPLIRDAIELWRARRTLISDVVKDSWLEQIPKSRHWLLKDSKGAIRPLQYRIVLDGFAGEDAMLGRVLENKYVLERRYPFRDRELCEFMLAIPTEQLVKLGVKRPIVKRAFHDDFTPELRVRNDKTDFSVSLINGIKRDTKWRSWLRREPRAWQRYVKKRNLSEQSEQDVASMVVSWRCAYYNFWHSMWYDSADDKGE